MHNNKELTKLWSKGHRIQNPFRIEENLGKNHDVPRSETLIILIAEINIKIQQRVDAESEQ